jgi:hypothetical protein
MRWNVNTNVYLVCTSRRRVQMEVALERNSGENEARENVHNFTIRNFIIYSHHLTNSVEVSATREATSCTANRYIRRILWKPKAHYRVHKNSPPIPILSQTSPAPTNQSYLYKIYLNVIHPPTS